MKKILVLGLWLVLFNVVEAVVPVDRDQLNFKSKEISVKENARSLSTVEGFWNLRGSNAVDELGSIGINIYSTIVTSNLKSGMFTYDIYINNNLLAEGLKGFIRSGGLIFTIPYLKGHSLITATVNSQRGVGFYAEYYVSDRQCLTNSALAAGIYVCEFSTAVLADSSSGSMRR